MLTRAGKYVDCAPPHPPRGARESLTRAATEHGSGRNRRAPRKGSLIQNMLKQDALNGWLKNIMRKGGRLDLSGRGKTELCAAEDRRRSMQAKLFFFKREEYRTCQFSIK